nr:PREDICTED: uncharacterized protein LOC100875397 [Megachile rotundata]
MKLSTLYLVYTLLGLIVLANSQGTLLEMSQQMWTKLLTGGFSKTGKLDPLKVPVIKVDQSEGDTSYRIILRNVEIGGLNKSTLESIHIARGRLKSNLSEVEAGYVSYSDLRDLDSIRYRFHTLIKEPKVQNESFEAIVSASDQHSRFMSAPREQEKSFERLRQYDPFLMKIQADKMREAPKSEQKSQDSGVFSMDSAKVVMKDQIVENIRYPSDVQMIYAMSALNAGLNPTYEQKYQGRAGSERREDPRENQRRGYVNGRTEARFDDVQTSASENVESRVRGSQRFPAYVREQAPQDTRLEKQPGYIDIVYADGEHHGGVKRFGNGRIESKEGTQVFGMKDVAKEILEGKRTITHDCTSGEPLTKRNDAIKAAINSNSMRNLTRYAKDYQEKQGYFEEGMQLLYHYGGNPVNEKVGLGKRYKRAHSENETDDDVMHVILKIRVPQLHIKADYQLTGKVGKELVRGNGKLNGNFSEVTGDFTIELTKDKRENILIVRAARSKLSGKKENISLQGMDEEGPVQSILNHGLMAAEAVAAMLADDLATKALNDRTADAMIYKMYKDLPVN